MEELQKMKVADLKKELKERGLTVSGTKAELIDRLQEAMGSGDSVADDSVEKSIDQLVEDKPAAANPLPVKAPANPDKPKENVEKSPVNSSDESTEKKVVSMTGLTDADKLKARAEKFGGAVSESARKLMRAERFGLPASSAKPLASSGTNKLSTTPVAPEDLDKMKKRAERFGSVVSGKLSKVDEDERRQKRMERFGGTAITAPTEPKKVKLDTTGDKDAEDKKRKRAERFGLT